jgi:poly(3-hydroxybutyrate) depolymerase
MNRAALKPIHGTETSMKYQAYEAYATMMAPMRLFMRSAVSACASWTGAHPAAITLGVACDMLSSMRITHTRPGFGLGSIRIGEGGGARELAVREEAVHVAPFGTLLRFKKEGAAPEPKVLIVAPLSGHFASQLRETVRVMLRDHDVYITDWHNARDVPLATGRFDLDDYARYLIAFLEVMGPGAHMVAICQSCVAALVAASIMAEDRHPAQPRSLTLMAGPIDSRINPTEVSRFATSAPIEWFDQHLISTVPPGHSGAMRRVCPGFLQLPALMSVDLEQHMNSFLRLTYSLCLGQREEADKVRAYYQDYFAVLDLPAEFYLSTLARVFQKPVLPLGEYRWRGRLVHPSAIRRTALLTVEGERDEFCSTGQTAAAHALCSRIPRNRKFRHVQPGAGHKDLFSGRVWNEQIYPAVRDVIRASQ